MEESLDTIEVISGNPNNVVPPTALQIFYPVVKPLLIVAG
jgi:hypothetical protein